MKILPQLRELVFLRRIAIALEEGNRLARERMALEYPAWARENKLSKTSKIVELGAATIEDFNSRYKAEHGLEE